MHAHKEFFYDLPINVSQSMLAGVSFVVIMMTSLRVLLGDFVSETTKYEGCPSKSWTLIIKQDCAMGIP